MNDRERFYSDYTKALREGTAALFAGAGLSVPSGYVNWKELLRPLARRLGLDVDQETDLPALAQFAVNEAGGDRADVSQRILEELTRDVSLSENHRLLARLPLRTVWTTNYDDLLEKAFEEAGKRPDPKRRTTSLVLSPREVDVTLYKMHGDITEPERAVITQDDYETYNEDRQLFTTTLQADLAAKTFLFLGFSFTDTNLGSILSRMRGLLKKHKRTHFWIEKRKDKESEHRRQQHQVLNLRRYGIYCLLVEQYSEITEILKELQRRLRQNNVFISGSVEEPGTMGQERLEKFAMKLSGELIRKGYTVSSGFGRGLGEAVYAGAYKVLHEPKSSAPRGRLELHPMPRGLPPAERKAAYTQRRKEVISQTGFTLTLCGNKRDDSTGTLVVGSGIREEFELAVKEGSRPIPIAATGLGAPVAGAVDLWNEVMKKLDTYYPEGGVEPFFKVLGDVNSSDEQLLEAIFGIIERVAPRP